MVRIRSGEWQSHPFASVQGHDHSPVRIDGHPEVVRLVGLDVGLGLPGAVGCRWIVRDARGPRGAPVVGVEGYRPACSRSLRLGREVYCVGSFTVVSPWNSKPIWIA